MPSPPAFTRLRQQLARFIVRAHLALIAPQGYRYLPELVRRTRHRPGQANSRRAR